MNIRTVGALAVAVSVGLSASAFAHPHLRTSTPPVNGAVTSAMKELRLTFSETVNPKVSGVKVLDSKGVAIPTNAARQDAKNRKQLVVPLKASLKPGQYQLTWFAVGKDMHRVPGRYAFAVRG